MKDGIFIFVGCVEQGNCFISVNYNTTEDSILEEILEYSDLGFIDWDEQVTYRKFPIIDWQTQIVECYSEFIIKRIKLLKGKYYESI